MAMGSCKKPTAKKNSHNFLKKFDVKLEYEVKMKYTPQRKNQPLSAVSKVYRLGIPVAVANIAILVNINKHHKYSGILPLDWLTFLFFSINLYNNA